jgi:hypothetical protein
MGAALALLGHLSSRQPGLSLTMEEAMQLANGST